MSKPSSAGPYAWQTHLDVEDAAESSYHNDLNPRLADLIAFAPRLMLDIGCAAGQFGALVKQRYRGARVVGVELNRAAAAAARTRLDHVLEGRFEDVDLSLAGISPGSVDTVVVADVLEHLYNPWRVMTELKQHLTRDAQIIASIPNTRNLVLLRNLIDGGTWRYEQAGLLDVTHIRFFTLAEIKSFFAETGYRVEQVVHNLQSGLEPFYEQHKNEAQIGLNMGRVTLEPVTPDELAELCTFQFFVRARPAWPDAPSRAA